MKEHARVIVVKDGQALVMHRHKEGAEYYTLVGGEIEAGETPEQAMYREVLEETGLTLDKAVLTYIDDSTDIYGPQYIFRAAYLSGEVQLSPDSFEAHLNAIGKNTYEPEWQPIEALADLPLFSPALKDRLVRDLEHGFAEEVITLHKI